MNQRVSSVQITRVAGDSKSSEPDLVAVEEPLEIRVGYGPEDKRQQATITVTMRTPGNDEQLCLGFLFTEGIINDISDVLSAKYCSNATPKEGGDNVMRVELAPLVIFSKHEATRNYYTNSSCGVCGKASIDHIKTDCLSLIENKLHISRDKILGFPEKLEDIQDVFKHTGGLHASGIFNSDGNLIQHKEDVGRHNALDKVIGTMLLNHELPGSDNVLMLSGRISFELIQKAAKAGIPIVAAVGAPSSLAISLAFELGITLIGFVKEHGYNIYTHAHRITD